MIRGAEEVDLVNSGLEETMKGQAWTEYQRLKQENINAKEEFQNKDKGKNGNRNKSYKNLMLLFKKILHRS